MASAEQVDLVGVENTTDGDTPVPCQDKDPPSSEAADGGIVVTETSVPEKLKEDDVMRPPFYKRVLYSVFPQLERS